MNRRGFMGSILAAGVAPAIVRADSLMRIVPRETAIIVPSWSDALYGGARASGKFYIALYTGNGPPLTYGDTVGYREYSRVGWAAA